MTVNHRGPRRAGSTNFSHMRGLGWAARKSRPVMRAKVNRFLLAWGMGGRMEGPRCTAKSMRIHGQPFLLLKDVVIAGPVACFW